MVQVPPFKISTVPEVVTVQILEVADVNETANPEDAVAVTSKFASVALLLDSALKVIDCGSGIGASTTHVAPLIRTGK